MNDKMVNSFEVAQRQFDEAAGLLGLSPAIQAVLREPMREVAVTIPVKMDDGSVQIFKGYRVQYNNARGPTKGGICASTPMKPLILYARWPHG